MHRIPLPLWILAGWLWASVAVPLVKENDVTAPELHRLSQPQSIIATTNQRRLEDGDGSNGDAHPEEDGNKDLENQKTPEDEPDGDKSSDPGVDGENGGKPEDEGEREVPPEGDNEDPVEQNPGDDADPQNQNGGSGDPKGENKESGDKPPASPSCESSTTCEDCYKEEPTEEDHHCAWKDDACVLAEGSAPSDTAALCGGGAPEPPAGETHDTIPISSYPDDEEGGGWFLTLFFLLAVVGGVYYVCIRRYKERNPKMLVEKFKEEVNGILNGSGMGGSGHSPVRTNRFEVAGLLGDENDDDEDGDNDDDDDDWGWGDDSGNKGGDVEMPSMSSGNSSPVVRRTASPSISDASSDAATPVPSHKSLNKNLKHRTSGSGDNVLKGMDLKKTPTSGHHKPSVPRPAPNPPVQRITSLGKPKRKEAAPPPPPKQEDDIFASMGLAAKPTFTRAKHSTSPPPTPPISNSNWDDDADLDDLLND